MSKVLMETESCIPTRERGNETELSEDETTEDFSVVRQEGKRQVQRNLKHYNLNAIFLVPTLPRGNAYGG